MKKQFFLAAALVLICFTGLIKAQNKDLDFKVINLTQLSIDELYLTPVDSEEWGDDVLGVDVLENEESCDISFHPAADVCEWDLKIIDGQGKEIIWSNLNLCEINELTLYWENGKAWAEKN